MSQPTRQPDDIEAMSFEAAFGALEETLARLESGDLMLDEALSLYEYGMALAQRCQTQLDAAELRVQKLAPDGDLAAFEV